MANPRERKHARDVLYSVGAPLNAENIDKMAAAIRTAVAERDAEWREAVRARIAYCTDPGCATCPQIRKLMEEQNG